MARLVIRVEGSPPGTWGGEWNMALSSKGQPAPEETELDKVSEEAPDEDARVSDR
jgi:hypothetical protein